MSEVKGFIGVGPLGLDIEAYEACGLVIEPTFERALDELLEAPFDRKGRSAEIKKLRSEGFRVLPVTIVIGNDPLGQQDSKDAREMLKSFFDYVHTHSYKNPDAAVADFLSQEQK